MYHRWIKRLKLPFLSKYEAPARICLIFSKQKAVARLDFAESSKISLAKIKLISKLMAIKNRIGGNILLILFFMLSKISSRLKYLSFVISIKNPDIDKKPITARNPPGKAWANKW